MRGLGNVNEGEGAIHVRLVLDLLVCELPVYSALDLTRLLQELERRAVNDTRLTCCMPR